MDSNILKSVIDYCDANEIDLKDIETKHVVKSLKKFEVGESKRSYIKTVCRNYNREDFDTVLTGDRSIYDLYKKRGIEDQRGFDDAIDAIHSNAPIKINNHDSNDNKNESSLFHFSKVFSSLYRNGKITKEEFAEYINCMFQRIEIYNIKKFIDSNRTYYDGLNLCLYQQELIVKAFVKE